MPVKSNIKNQNPQLAKYDVVAADILNKEHPLHNTFLKWLGNAEPTKRKARKFLQKFPNYRHKEKDNA